MRKKKILIACAGSGGHFYPGLGLAEGWSDKLAKVYVSIEKDKKRSQHQKEILQQKKISYFCLNSPPLPQGKIGIFIFLFYFFVEFLKAVYFLIRHRIDSILVMGSFANASVAVAGLVCFKKIYLHESNIILGKANRFLVKYARKVFAVFPFWDNSKIQHGKWLQREIKKKNFRRKFIQVKLPLRKEILNLVKEKNNKQKLDDLFVTFGLKKNKKTIFLFGGSQGAEKINENFISFLKNLSSKDWQIIHLTGEKDNTKYKKNYQKMKFNFFVAGHFEQIGKCYLLADIVICRSGASTLAEIEFFNKKAILIPYPWAIYQHQYYNAVYFAKRNDNIAILEQKYLTASSLWNQFSELKKKKKNDRKKLEYLEVANKILKKIV